ncbi:unnamed protein product [Protopolystoma xenopodis]|uniref:Uncharacterized protein n=1 Tax=Protopolystoma xenopodis TaxID=117903 RepID=A0A448WN84_9PLAT|nr:unnamed protein product [Protopolystoma xenopodis]
MILNRRSTLDLLRVGYQSVQTMFKVHAHDWKKLRPPGPVLGPVGGYSPTQSRRPNESVNWTERGQFQQFWRGLQDGILLVNRLYPSTALM